MDVSGSLRHDSGLGGVGERAEVANLILHKASTPLFSRF
jgi:hypothetical protein